MILSILSFTGDRLPHSSCMPGEKYNPRLHAFSFRVSIISIKVSSNSFPRLEAQTPMGVCLLLHNELLRVSEDVENPMSYDRRL
jgi:hypothetical protein